MASATLAAKSSAKAKKPTTSSPSTAKKSAGRPAKSLKRKSEDEDDETIQANATASKSSRAKARKIEKPAPNATAASLKAAQKSDRPAVKRGRAAVRDARPKPAINQPPTRILKVYVFGNNEQGELGLGDTAGSKPVKRPRLNPHLLPEKVAVVQVASGGMHCAALTNDNRILTWGVNDLGALGRDTEWSGGWVDKKDDADSDDESESEVQMNPKETTPIAIDASSFPEGTVFTQVECGDNATFAVTSMGDVWAWGTFKGGDGAMGFSAEVKIQRRPVPISTLENVKKVAAGSNHAVALTASGAVLAWGFGEQNQLGRRLVERTRMHGLTPQNVGLRKDIVDIGTGADHSFALHKNGSLYSWGLNNYCQTGIDDKTGPDFANILKPRVVKSLQGHGTVVSIDGGNHHTVAVTGKGECLAWGRLDTFATGLDIPSLPADELVKDARGNPRILISAQRVPVPNALYAAAGSDHSLAVTKEGKAYSWGFSVNCQTGQGTDEDVKTATMIDNTAVREQRLVWAGAGGQYSALASEDASLPNGHS